MEQYHSIFIISKNSDLSLTMTLYLLFDNKPVLCQFCWNKTLGTNWSGKVFVTQSYESFTSQFLGILPRSYYQDSINDFSLFLYPFTQKYLVWYAKFIRRWKHWNMINLMITCFLILSPDLLFFIYITYIIINSLEYRYDFFNFECL